MPRIVMRALVMLITPVLIVVIIVAIKALIDRLRSKSGTQPSVFLHHDAQSVSGCLKEKTNERIHCEGKNV